jgi:hypothetical protein
MRSIETTAVVSSDRKITVQLPADIRPGAHRIVVVIDEAPADIQPGPQPIRATPQIAPPTLKPLTTAAHFVGIRLATNTFRREHLYDDIRY